ncbi:MAG: hypothetical protein ACRD96_20780 [Bryobacteraceae bacterium]
MLQKVAKGRHPGRELGAAECGAEPVAAFLIEVQLGHGSGAVQIEKQLCGAVGRVAIGGCGQLDLRA